MMERTNYNNLTIEAFRTSLTTAIDHERDLTRAQNVRFSTVYPGGRFLNASLFIPREVGRFWQIKGMQRFIIWNGETIVFEGALTSGFGQWKAISQGVKLNLTGPWGKMMMHRGINKPWLDTRVSPDVWVWQTSEATYTAVDWFRVERDDGDLHLHTMTGTIPNSGLVSLKYTAPTGQTIKAFRYDWIFSEGGGDDFAMRVWNVQDAGVEPNTSHSAAGSGTDVIALNQGGQGSLTQSILFQMISNKVNNVTIADHDHAEWNRIAITTGAVGEKSDAGYIAKDIVSHLSADLNSDVTNIGDPDNEIKPFITEGYEMAASILMRATSFGDNSNNSWAVGLLPSEDATTPDGKPVLFLEQQPDLDDYDYAIRVDEANLVPPFSVEQDWYAIKNWIIVEYRDENGWRQTITPDDATMEGLKDTDSITLWGQREKKLSIGSSTAADALIYGKRYLAHYKDIQWTMNQPIRIKGYIRNKDGGITPSSEIYAGMRIKIQNFLQDLSGTGLTLLITKTTYTDSDEICTLWTGVPLPIIPLPVLAPPQPPTLIEPPVPGGGDDPVSEEQRWKLIGVSYETWVGMTTAERRAAAIAKGVEWWL